jgi:hypothetical protein
LNGVAIWFGLVIDGEDLKERKGNCQIIFECGMKTLDPLMREYLTSTHHIYLE